MEAFVEQDQIRDHAVTKNRSEVAPVRAAAHLGCFDIYPGRHVRNHSDRRVQINPGGK